jgi:hypothetical protein
LIGEGKGRGLSGCGVVFGFTALDGTHPTDGEQVELGGGLQVEFAFQAFPMGIDGFVTDVEMAGDRCAGQAASDEAEHFELPVGEFVEEAFGMTGRPADQGGGREGVLAGANPAQGLDQSFGRGGLREITGSAHGTAATGEEVFVEQGVDQDGKAGLPLLEFLEEIEAAASGEADVEDDEIGEGGIDQGEGFWGGAGFGDDFEVVGEGEEMGDAPTEEGLGIHHDDPEGFVRNG